MDPQRRSLAAACIVGPTATLLSDAFAPAAGPANPASATSLAGDPSSADSLDGRHDFDFYHGLWRVRNERLKQRLVGNNDWETFEATQRCRPVLDGIGNLDDFVTEWDGGFRGLTLRLFDLQAKRWRIYWASNRSGVLEPPVIGRFENGVGIFLGSDTHQGRPVLARFLWSDITPDSAHWQQAFSTDEGATWETNWHMWMTRIAQ